MRLTEFWRRMRAAFGESADTIAQDTVLSGLAHRTVREALAQGVSAAAVWRVVVSELELGEAHR